MSSNSISEDLAHYDEYGDWSEDWYEEEDPGIRCQACYGSGLDRYEDVDCMNCWGEGVVYGTV